MGVLLLVNIFKVALCPIFTLTNVMPVQYTKGTIVYSLWKLAESQELAEESGNEVAITSFP